jgi:hypothetical protein
MSVMVVAKEIQAIDESVRKPNFSNHIAVQGAVISHDDDLMLG